MLTTTNLTTNENISLSKEIALVAPTRTPFTTLLLANGRVEQATAKIHSWVEKSLDATEDIAAVEGADAANFVSSGRAELNNPLMIHSKATSVSGTVLAMPNVAGGDVLAGEINDRMTELKLSLEKSLLTEKRNDGSLTPFIRKMDGLLQWVHDDNIITPAAKLTEAHVLGLAEKLWLQGANNNMYLLTNATLLGEIGNIYKDNYNYNAHMTEFGINVTQIRTNFGVLNVLLSADMPVDQLVAFDLDAVSVAFLREPQYQPLSVVGDSQRGLVVCESTLRVDSKKAVASFTLSA